MLNRFIIRTTFIGLAAMASSTAMAVDVTGAGSSFVYPVASRWSAQFSDATGHRINYQSIGSGGGIAQVKAGTVDFAATDKPLDGAELDEAALRQFPLVIGGIVPVLNVTGVAPGALLLDGQTLAGVFLGKISNWNDPALRALNPGLTLPDAKITVVYRSDSSGTSFNFTNYLSKVSTDWQQAVGEGTTVRWPTGIGGKGNEGVAAYVRQIPNAIGYVEYAYAAQNAIAHARMRNPAGEVVSPDVASFQAAAASADWSSAGHFNVIMTAAPGAQAWPITAAVWVLMPSQPRHAERARVALEFFQWAFQHGRQQALDLDYVPLPALLVNDISAYWQDQLMAQ